MLTSARRKRRHSSKRTRPDDAYRREDTAMTHANTELVAFCRVPDFARGKVRDLRVRWALEEIGRPYSTDLLDAFEKRPPEHFAIQPFGQVPALREGNLE